MKRFFSLFLLLAVCLSLTISVSAEEALVYDQADLLTDSQETRLQAQLSAVSQQYAAQIIVVTLSAADGHDVDYLTEYIYDGMNFGYGSNRDGVMLLVCMDPRQYRILSNGYAGDAISPGVIDSIGDAIVSDLSDGDYADAFEEFAVQCAYYLDGHVNGFPFPLGRNLLIALAIGLAAGLITVLIMKSQLKSVRQQNQANVYMKSGSMHLTGSSDVFLYRNVSRTRRQTSSSSGSRSGGSRSMGGGSF